MTRMTEASLVEASTKYATEFVGAKFKQGTDIEKSLVLNGGAHGYYMGVRHFENCLNRPWWKFWVKRLTVWPEDKLINESIKGANAYIKARYRKLDFVTVNLIRAVVSGGFREGLRAREQGP